MRKRNNWKPLDLTRSKEPVIGQFTTRVVPDVSLTDECVAAIAQIENDDIAAKYWDDERNLDCDCFLSWTFFGS